VAAEAVPVKGKGTLLLAAILAMLLGGYWLTGLIETRSEERAALLRRAFEFQADEVVELTIERAGEAAVAGTRTANGAWTITAPHEHIRANSIVWNRLAEAVSKLAFERIIDEDPDRLEPYEMTPPHLRVTFATRGGESGEITAGAIDPTQAYRYFRVDDGPIGLTPVALFHELNRPLLDLRERYIIPPSEEGVARLEYAKVYTGGIEKTAERTYVPEIGEESVRVVVQRDPAGRWHMLDPIEAPAKQERVDALVNELQYSAGRGYVDAPGELSLYGLDPPEHRITLIDGATGETQTLELGWAAEEDTKAGIFAKLVGNPSVFVIDGHVLTLLPESPDAFRQTRLLAGEAVDLVQIKYTDDFTAFTLANDPQDGWTLTNPPHDDTDQEAVSRYIGFLKTAGGISFPENPEDTGFDAPQIAIEMTYKDGETTSILVGGPEPGTEPALYYTKQEDGSITTLPFEARLAMRATPFQFRERAIFRFRPDDAVEMRLRFEGTGYLLKKVGPRWVVTEPANSTLESQADARALLDALSKVKAAGVADPAPGPEATGLDEPIFEATVALARSNGTTAIHGPIQVGNTKAPAARERFTRVAGRDEILYVDQDLIDEVRAALRGIVSQ
jgi:hypothetical protein